jgi:type I restriction enzyme M protein
MNLFLHNIGDIDHEHVMISPKDSLIAASETRYDYVLANPPFGKKQHDLYQRSRRTGKRRPHLQPPDFCVTTSNKQLNFVQNIKSMLKTTGHAAVVLPDNVLFEGCSYQKLR